MLCFNTFNLAYAIQEPTGKQVAKTTVPARKIELAFVFDGPSDKNKEVLEVFQKTITKSLLPDYNASFPKDLIFTGNWTEASAKTASENALKSRAKMVISLGYMSSTYLDAKKNPNKNSTWNRALSFFSHYMPYFDKKIDYFNVIGLSNCGMGGPFPKPTTLASY